MSAEYEVDVADLDLKATLTEALAARFPAPDGFGFDGSQANEFLIDQVVRGRDALATLTDLGALRRITHRRVGEVVDGEQELEAVAVLTSPPIHAPGGRPMTAPDSTAWSPAGAELAVWKYPIDIEAESETKSIPLAGGVVHVGLDPQGDACFWAVVCTHSQAPLFELRLRLVGTGQPVATGSAHLGSFIRGAEVWHLFAETDR